MNSRRLCPGRPGLHRLSDADLRAVLGDPGVEAHILGLEGRDPEAPIGEQAAEGGDKSALAGMGGGAEDHEKAGHGDGEAVQAYLPFGRWSFLIPTVEPV